MNGTLNGGWRFNRAKVRDESTGSADQMPPTLGIYLLGLPLGIPSSTRRSARCVRYRYTHTFLRGAARSSGPPPARAVASAPESPIHHNSCVESAVGESEIVLGSGLVPPAYCVHRYINV
eukprot:COSAG02_NODE_220_length_28426_cov_28.546863_21_plen_120_part_00